MDKFYVLEDAGNYDSISGDGYYTGYNYIHQGDRYAETNRDIKKAKKYKSKKRLESYLNNKSIPSGGGRRWKIAEVSDDSSGID